MHYNKIRSKIRGAASKLLSTGKMFLEEFEIGDSVLTEPIKQMVHACKLDHSTKDLVTEDLQSQSRGSAIPKKRCSMASSHSEAAVVTDQMKEAGCFEQRDIVGMISGGEVPGESSFFLPAGVASVSIEDANLAQGDYVKKKETCESGPQLQLDADADAGEVDIKQCKSHEVVRADSDSQATESSSSFGCSLDEGDTESDYTRLWDSTEAQSRLRNGSRGLLSSQDEALVAEHDLRKKRALNQEWKAYRRGIEWRCRWLELRMKALQDQALRYSRFLEEKRTRKPWGGMYLSGITSASRTVPFTYKHIKQSILHRKRRRKVEDGIDVADFMSRHPLFSRYEKKRQEQEDPHAGRFQNQHFRHIEDSSMGLEEINFPDESDMDELPLLIKGTILGEDSIEELLCNIESLQARIIKLRGQLTRVTYASSSEMHSQSAWQELQAQHTSPIIQVQGVHSPLPSPRGAFRPPRHCTNAGLSPVDPSKSASSNAQAQKVSGSFRRRTADYDISNVVMPVNVGAKYVEPVRHAKIATPHWRRLDSSALPHPSEGSSSYEDTDDETYLQMHNRMEERERLQRIPCSLKRHTDISGTVGTMCTVVKARGKVTNMDSIDLDRKGEDHDNLADDFARTYSVAFPKGKRSRHHSKGNFTFSRGRKLLNSIPET